MHLDLSSKRRNSEPQQSSDSFQKGLTLLEYSTQFEDGCLCHHCDNTLIDVKNCAVNETKKHHIRFFPTVQSVGLWLIIYFFSVVVASVVKSTDQCWAIW